MNSINNLKKKMIMKTLHTIYTSFAKRLVMSLMVLMTVSVGSVLGAEFSLTNATIKSSRDGKTSYGTYTINEFSGKWLINLNGSTYSLQLGYNTSSSKSAYNSHLAISLPDGANNISVYIKTNNSTASGRTFYACNSNNKGYVNSGDGDYGKGSTSSSNGAATIQISGNPSIVYIYPNGTAYIEYVTVTYDESASCTYTVTFNGNGNTGGSMSAQEFNCGESKALTTNAFTKTGHTFAGWATSANGSVTYSDKQSVNLSSTNDATITLYARWTPKQITITWNANGGSVIPTTSSYTYDGSSVTLPTPTRDGYNFKGWYTSASGGSQITEIGTTNKPTTNVTYYAQWTEKQLTNYRTKCQVTTHTVTFDSDGGSAVTEQTIENGKTATKPNDPTKAGHTFIGWYNGDTEFDFSTQITGDIELKAKWTINQYKVTLNPNYPDGKTGTFTYDAGELVDGNLVLTYDYNTTSKTIADLYTSLTLDGYEFGGWYNAKGANPGEVSGSKCTETSTITGDKTYYAKWTPTYTITWMANGQQYGEKQEVVDGQTIGTLPNEPDAPGACSDKEFMGWTESATVNNDGTSITYISTSTKPDGDKTYHAVFATKEETTDGTVDATLSFANTQNRVSHSDSKHVWAQNDITFTNNKASSTSNVNDAYNPIRCYKNSSITITHTSNEITKIVFDCNGTNDASHISDLISPLENSGTGTVTRSDDIITITFNKSQKSFTLTLSSGQVRLDGITVTTGGGTTTSYSDYTTSCVKLPDPVWNGATIDKTALTVNCGERSPMTGANGAAIISFPTEKIYNFTKDITIEATTGFLVSTSQSVDANYKSSVYLSPLVGTANANTFYDKHVYVRAEAPAQSDTDLEGTITIKNSKGETLQTFSVTADVTCTQYTLTLVDRGVSTEQPIKYYAGETIDEAPADPEGVCTDPIHYVFDGWAEARVAEGSVTYTKVTFPYTVTGNTKFYAVYRYIEEGSAVSGDYEKVTSDLDDYSGDYLIVYEAGNVAFNGGLDDLDVISNTISVTINSNTIESNATTDAAKFTIAKVDGGYSIQSASGYYIGRSATSNGLSTNETYSANYDLNTITDCKTIKGKGGNILKYNKTADQKRFRYYQSGQESIALYRKAASYLYTTSPACGPHLEITAGKEIYVTGGNAKAARDLVMAQQKVSYKATRLNTKDGSAGGAAPDVVVADNGITKNGIVTSEVKVTFENTIKEQQVDGTYTITGDIVVTYEAEANNLKEDIQVQLVADYNAEAKDNFTVHARSLPSEFVIVAKSGDKWYALNADMSRSKAQPANGQVTLNDLNNPTEAIYAPCNAIYTFEAMPQGAEDRKSVRFIGMENKYLWAASEGNNGVQNNSKAPAADALAYNWKLYTEDNITYRFGNAQNTRMLGLHSTNVAFGMYANGASVVQDIRILPYVEKCIYNYAPSNLKVSVLKGTYVTLTWDAVAGATKYQYSTNGTTWTDAGTEPTATITGLTSDKEYTYYIRAYHEDAGVSQECIDYAKITFTTADCDDVPADITYSADLTSITVTWTAVSTNCTVRLYSDEACEAEDQIKFADELKGSVTFSQLDRNTTYYVRVFAEGTCASPIVPVKTEDVELDIVEWDKDKIYVDINTNEKVSVTLENEVSYGSGSGKKADELFFSKYFEGSGSLKMIAIYNGTGKDVNLSEYRIDRGGNGDATNISKTYDLSQLGVIKQGQEIIFYSWPLTSEDSYSCSKSFLESKAQKSGLDANPRWILCDAKTHSGIEFEAMDFSGDDPLLFYKGNTLIDVFGVSKAAERPSSKEICSGRSDNCWSATGVSNMDYGKTTEDFPNGEIPYGVNVDDETITAYTARVIMFRKNTVVSGKNAVTKNTTTFATFADEWEARQVCRSGDDGDLTCAAYQELGTFDYSKYYTKFESMGDDLVFDTNSRNSDGTITVPISGLNKQSCRNIKITVKDANGDVLKSQDYKVPIMITTDQETAYTDENKNQNAFYALQENLATVEVDGNGNPTGNKTNLTLEHVREICKTCDVVVRDNATLTKVTDGTTNDHPQVRNVYVYEGASIVIPDGENHNYTINGLSLRRKGDVVASAQVQGTGKFVLPADEPVCLDLRVDANNWHWFTLPYDCDIADVTWVDGTPAKYNTDWFLMYYDGESRAASTNPYDNHWKVYDGTTIEAGKGYIVGITGDLTHPNYTFELRFPMAQGVLTAEQTRKTVPVNAWGVKSDNKPNNLGWNLVGNPYLNYYKTADEYSLAGLPLIKYTSSDLVVGEFYEKENGSIPFLVTPIDGGWYEYRQELASEVNMMPFTAYFVQVGDPDNPDHTDGKELNASFEASNRGKKSIVRRAPREVEEIEEPIIVRVELTNSKGESDKTSLVIDDCFTNEYEMNGDFFKWFGDYYNYYTKPVLYTIGADQGKRAFNALNEELAKQPIPMGMYAAQAGNYTFSLNQQFDLSRVEEVWLYDATQSTYTNLMQSDYTFSTSKVNGAGRFSLSVKLAPKVATSIDNVTADKVWATTHTKQVIVNGLENGMHLWLYDATGKLLYNEPTSNYQHTYSVPQTGTYFVSVMNGNQKQTIKVVVE